jgi:hypothetical protein
VRYRDLPAYNTVALDPARSPISPCTRRLAQADPTRHEPALAQYLNNLSVRLAARGRRDDGLAAIEEAVGQFEPRRGLRPYLARPVCESPRMRKSTASGSIHTLEEALPLVDSSSHRKSHAIPTSSHERPEENHDLNPLTSTHTRRLQERQEAGEIRKMNARSGLRVPVRLAALEYSAAMPSSSALPVT